MRRNAKEKHRETVAETETLRLQLEDAQKRVEEMEDRFEESLKKQLDTENALNEVREEFANRSTDSEARQRDEQLFDHKEAVERLQQVLDKERAEHATVVEAAVLVLSKDLEESRERINRLEKELEGASSSSKNLKLAENKIHRLRAERDELRTSLHFVNHEQRFTNKEVETHQLSLRTARDALDKQTITLAILQQQYLESGETSTQLKTDLVEATAARDGLLMQVARLETELQAKISDCREQEAQSGSLASDWALAKSRAERANAELVELRRVNRELEVQYDRAQATLEAKMQTQAIHEAEDTTAGPQRPASTEGRRVRRISGLQSAPSMASDQLEKLKIAHADTVGRLKRRDAAIRDLENQLKQKDTNLDLANEASAENLAQAEKLEKDLEAANLEVDSLRKELADIEKALRQAESETRVHAKSLEQVIIALAAEHHSARRNATLWAKRVELLGESDSAIDRVSVMASTTIEHAKSQIVLLSQQALGFKTQIAETKSQLDKAQSSELALQEQLHQQLEASRSTESTLQQQLESLQQLLHESSTKLAELEQTSADLRPIAERVAGLEKELEASREETSMRQADVDTLLNKLANAEKNRGASQEEAAALSQTMAELSTARDQVASLKQEQHTLLEELTDLQKIQDEMNMEHHVAIEASAKGHVEEVSQLNTTVASLQREIQSKLAELDLARAGAGDLELRLAAQDAKFAELEVRAQNDQTTIGDLRTQLADLERKTARLGELSAALADDRTTIEQLHVKISGLEASSQDLRDERDNLSARVQQLDSDLSVAQLDRSVLSELRTKVAGVEASSALIRAERDTLSARVHILEKDLASAGQDDQTQLVEMRSRISGLETSGAALEQERINLSTQLNKLNITLSMAQTKEETLEREVEASKSRVASLEKELSNALDSLHSAKQGAVDAQKSSLVLQGEAVTLRKENADLVLQLEMANSGPLAASDSTEELRERVAGKSWNCIPPAQG